MKNVKNADVSKRKEKPMLFHKKEKEEPRVCTECGCLVAYERAHKVETNPDIGYYYPVSYYCGICAPPYNKIEETLIRPKYFVLVSEHYEEITEEGKPLKKKK